MIYHRCWFIGVWGLGMLIVRGGGLMIFVTCLPGFIAGIGIEKWLDSHFFDFSNKTLFPVVIGITFVFVALCSWLMDKARLSKRWVLVMLVAFVVGGCVVLIDGYEYCHWRSLPEVSAAIEYGGDGNGTYSAYVWENLLPKIVGNGFLGFYAVLLCGGVAAAGKLAWAAIGAAREAGSE